MPSEETPTAETESRIERKVDRLNEKLDRIVDQINATVTQHALLKLSLDQLEKVLVKNEDRTDRLELRLDGSLSETNEAISNLKVSLAEKYGPGLAGGGAVALVAGVVQYLVMNHG